MQTDRGATSSDEEFSVRLSWPGPEEVGHPEEDSSSDEGPPGGQEVVAGGGPADAAPLPTTTPAHFAEVLVPGEDGSRVSRAFVDAFDRLSDRLLDRVRALRQDVDADMASLRSEISGLRQAVDDAGDRAPLRQLKAGLDEVHEEVVALRRAVLEWPAIEQLAADVAAVRSDLAFLFETSEDGSPAAAPSELLAELRIVVTSLSDEVSRLADHAQLAGLAPLVEEVGAVRSELSTIRRRLVLRSSPIDDEQLERIVDAVASRVAEEPGGGKRKRR